MFYKRVRFCFPGRFADKPVCKHNQKLTYGVARNENTEIVCEVDAYPAPDVFKWTFNKTGGGGGVASEMGGNEVVQHTRPGETGTGRGGGAGGPSLSGKHGKLSSVLTYSPTTGGMGGGHGGNAGDNDYGTVTCRASNTAGQQMEPCVFHVIAAGKYPITDGNDTSVRNFYTVYRRIQFFF